MKDSHLYRLDDAAHATVLAALREYQRIPARLHLPEIVEIATNSGAVEALTMDEIDTLCEALNRPGLDFSEVVNVFGETAEQSPYVAAARAHPLLSEGTLEVDEPTVVSVSSDNGAYVLAWLWVDDEAAGIEPEPEE